MNPYEKICKKWVKGCSRATSPYPEECENCTKSFLAAVKILVYKEDEKEAE